MTEKLHNHDGIDNHEHFFDMLHEAEVLFENIKDNTDTVFELLKADENLDEDVLDALKIKAGDILEIEKLSTPIFEQIKNFCELKQKNHELNLDQENFNKWFNYIKSNEEKSNSLFEKFIKNFNNNGE